MVKDLTITIKTLFGFEEALVLELSELGYTKVDKLNRAVQLKGSWEDVYYLNLYLRTGMTVLVELMTFTFRDNDDLYKKTKSVDWTSWFDMKHTFAIKGSIFSDLFPNTQFPQLLIKDAIVDQFREKYNDRPNVDLKAPHISVDVYIAQNKCTLSINTTGAPLYKRGYRTETGLAPMNEVAAAGLLYLSGWDRKSTFVDPMCGSGTLAIEAALLATGIPSNIERQHYAFKNLKNYQPEIWNKIYDEAPKRPVKLDFDIIASDVDQLMITKAKRNIRVLPVSRNVTFQIASFEDLKKPAESGTLITNPPYGERIGEDVEDLYQKLGDWFKHEMTGFECWVISSNEDALKQIALRPSRKMKLFNGSLECSFRNYSIYAGSKKGRKMEGGVSEEF